MNKKILLLVTILILAFSTAAFADDGETGSVGFCGETQGTGGETGQVGFCGETGAGNLFEQFLNMFAE